MRNWLRRWLGIEDDAGPTPEEVDQVDEILREVARQEAQATQMAGFVRTMQLIEALVMICDEITPEADETAHRMARIAATALGGTQGKPH